jgi:hypothetical protein
MNWEKLVAMQRNNLSEGVDVSDVNSIKNLGLSGPTMHLSTDGDASRRSPHLSDWSVAACA